MSEINFAEIFGANEQGVADPAINETPEGANEQGVADPAINETPEGANEQGVADPADGEKHGDERQSPEENARFAAARRKAEAERDAAIAKARAEVEEKWNKLFADSGLANPYTGQPIKTGADFEAYTAQFSAEKRAQLLKSSGMSEEDLNRLIESSPQMQQAREKERQAQAAIEEQGRQRLQAEVKEISQMDPTIKSLEDLAQTPAWEEVYGYVKNNGLSLTEAYRLANYDQLTAAATNSAAAAAAQAARNAVQSKQHLGRSAGTQADLKPVPEGTKRIYQILEPGISEEEMLLDYNRSLKQTEQRKGD